MIPTMRLNQEADSRSRQIPAEEMLLALMKAHEAASGPLYVFFKNHGLTSQQYNVLRILYVAGERIPLQKIGTKLITRVPDVSRLIDRLETMQFVYRARCETDRRVVFVGLSDTSKNKMEEIDPLLVQQISKLGSGLSEDELHTLSALLEKLLTTLTHSV